MTYKLYYFQGFLALCRLKNAVSLEETIYLLPTCTKSTLGFSPTGIVNHEVYVCYFFSQGALHNSMHILNFKKSVEMSESFEPLQIM